MFPCIRHCHIPLSSHKCLPVDLVDQPLVALKVLSSVPLPLCPRPPVTARISLTFNVSRFDSLSLRSLLLPPQGPPAAHPCSESVISHPLLEPCVCDKSCQIKAQNNGQKEHGARNAPLRIIFYSEKIRSVRGRLGRGIGAPPPDSHYPASLPPVP